MFKKKIKKIDLAKNLSSSFGFTQKLSVKIIDDIFEIIIDNIKDGNFNLKNIGSFKVLQKKERLGRNPKTREEFIISFIGLPIFIIRSGGKPSLSKYSRAILL